MAVRPPKAIARKPETDPLSAALDQEILAEKVGTYSRLLARAERALARLADCAPDDPAREARVGEAGEALWHAVVARELMGLRNTAAFLRDLKAPAEVRLRMGVVRPRIGVRGRLRGG